MPEYGQTLFQGTSDYFAKYRPVYPSGVIRRLVKRFQLDGTGCLLDLGSGTGQLTYRYADWFESIIGLDTQPEMIEVSKRLSEELRIPNIEWVQEKAEDFLAGNSQRSFQLVTMAKSFHWMDREEVLHLLFPMVTPGGGIAIIDDYEESPILEPWQQTMQAVVGKWYGSQRRAGATTFKSLEKYHEKVVEASKFELEIHRLPTREVTWTIESIIGHHYSTSYGAKRFLGGNAGAYEKELTSALLKLNPEGIFKEKKTVTIILGVKP